jgi:hypothetical protein
VAVSEKTLSEDYDRHGKIAVSFAADVLRYLVRALGDWEGVVHVHGEQCGVFSGRQTGEGSSEEPRLKVAELSPEAADRFAG